ncbi:DUF2066 domain-containing protein [Photobacterium galatheae]|uniref:DUF2066 domain-containing protein n=1 Tax=Photobacterium galatheae TaxID=1654360 RepID=A0A066RV35_9GAMM|nr:DUF2066 domain-containing protein [Photobacterium galatheae]KDM91228.1 hypothetical protein EA58_12850 [Photobacterium galatheae]MCM0148575.1 DUF2066 domain-containing protein [Photobacterium galatheae]
MWRFAFFLGALIALPLQAATVETLYQAQVSLPDTDSQTTRAARATALQQVLVKVSGQSNISDNEVIQKALENNSTYVSQLGHSSVNGQPTLDVSFDREKIRTLLTQANATFWSEQRPTILVWLIEDKHRDRAIVFDQSDNALQRPLNQAAALRGVPLLLPIGDFEDVTAISVPDLWGGFVQPIAKASTRYQPDAVMVVRVKGSDAKTQLTWQLFPGSPSAMLDGQAEPVEGRTNGSVAIQEMMNTVADHLAARYAIQLGGATEGGFAIEVANIRHVEDFFQLESLLKAMSSVAEVNATHLQGDRVRFSIQLLGNEQAFARELSMEPRLQSQPVTSLVREMAVEGATGVAPEGVIVPTSREGSASEPLPQLDVSATRSATASGISQYYWNPNA